QHVPGVMIIVVPLRAILAGRDDHGWIEQARAVVVVLQHQMDYPPALAGKVADRTAELLEQQQTARLAECMDGIEPQSVEAIISDPVQRVVDREGADWRAAIVDCRTPRRLRLAEEIRRIPADV